MSRLASIIDGAADRLRTIDGLRVSTFLPGQINPPTAVIDVGDIPEYGIVMARAKFELRPTVQLFLSNAVDRVAQARLVDYADTSGDLSIAAAIDADPTLGGAAEHARVVSFESLGLIKYGELDYLSGVFTLHVLGGI